MSDVNEYQVDGDHYGLSKIQHWDFTELNGLGYLEGCVTKYVTRNRKKHETPVKDLNKAIHYCKKLKALNAEGVRYNRRTGLELVITIEDFIAMNGLTLREGQVVVIMTHWEQGKDITDAIDVLESLLFEAQLVQELN